MTLRDRLTNAQIAIMKSLLTRGGYGSPVSLTRNLQFAVTALWRRELIQIWHRLSPGRGTEGPYYSLTHSGLRLATALANRAPRRLSGAEPRS